METRILLLGREGQVGWELQRSLSLLGEVIAWGSQEADFLRVEGWIDQVKALSPAVIVNAAGYTAVDCAETTHGKEAYTINVSAVRRLAEVAKEIGALFVSYSTDYVFDGSGTAFWTEADRPQPPNVYGQTKLEGEEAIQAVGGAYFIFRTSWVFSARRQNFLRTMLKLFQEKEALNVIDDQIGVPTGADLLADITALCVRDYLKTRTSQLCGLYHAVPMGEVSWFGYAQCVLQSAIQQGFSEGLKIKHLNPIPATEYPLPATRPQNSRLSTEKLRQTFDLHLPDWRMGVKRVVSELCVARGVEN